MKKNLFLMLMLIVLSTASVNAQVTIGSEYDPTPGSILDLQSNGSLGLLLPSVTLTDATVWAPVEGDETGVEGMAVYHNTDDMTNGLSGKGIYVWSNGSWSRMGASATPCVVVDASATQASFVGDIGSGKKLEVAVNQGSAPFNYIWYKDGNPLQTNSNKTEFKDSYLATDYGTYICEITNGCSRKEIKFNVSAVNVGDYQDTPAGVSWSMSGTTCFDVRELLVSSSVYTLSITGATATDVIWQITESSGANSLLSGSVVTNSDATLNFKSQSAVSEIAPAQITVTALITLSQGSKVNVQKVIKFQNKSCCDGAIIYNGAWDYTDMPGDGAKVGGADLTTDKAWSPNISTNSSWNDDALKPYFKSNGADLCVYKSDYKTNGTPTKINWADAINKCASGAATDGDSSGGWYLPNLYELWSITAALGGPSKTQSFDNMNAKGELAAPTENFQMNRDWVDYISSTEVNHNGAHHYRIDTGKSYTYNKDKQQYVRCVKRI